MRKRYLPAVLLAVGMSLIECMSVFAQGWVKQDNDWTYQDTNGNTVVNVWKKGADDLWRWLNSNGVMAVDTWCDNGQYYVDDKGKIISSCWKQMTPPGGGSTQYWYYFESNGLYVKGSWKKINNSWYHFDDEGHMETGWVDDDMYYLNDDGTMVTGWKQLTPPDGSNSYSDNTPSGNSEDALWYYFSSSGKKYIPENGADYGERKIDGTRYAFRSDGSLMTGWVNLEDSGTTGSITDYKYYNSDGTVRTGWYSLRPPEVLANMYENSIDWFYFSNTGEPKATADNSFHTGDIIKINGKSYMFDSNGTPVYGLKKVFSKNDESRYGAYYFGTKSQSCLQKGQITLENSGNNISFYFSDSSGEGYSGSHGGYVYYMGMLQKADSASKYEVISIPNGESKFYNYLINTSGKVMKSTSVKDNDGVKYTTNSSGIVTKVDDTAVTDTASFSNPTEPEFDQ